MSPFKSETPGSARFRFMSAIIGLVGLLDLNGCMSPIALHKAVLSCNRSINQLGAQELLLNIAQVRNHHPVQFTAVSSAAATFNF